MTAVVFYFQVHQPYRLRPYKPADVGSEAAWFDDSENRRIVRRVAERCYLPMNEILREQISITDGQFKCAFSLSGSVIQQLRDWAPKALDSFVELADTGCVEFLCETSHHSLAFEGDWQSGDWQEFEDQVKSHGKVIEDLFGQRPVTFRNTELCINKTLAKKVEDMGFDVLLGEGADRLMGWRSEKHVYRPKGCERLKLLLRSYVFSDDIAFRFSNREWTHYPLMADTFAGWLHAVPEQADYLGLFMDYETFGEHQWAKETGVLEFMRFLPGYVLEDDRFTFETPSALAARCEVHSELEIPNTVSWADQERDLTAWLGNLMQREAHKALYDLAPAIRSAALERPDLYAAWRKLTTSDHVYYMCTKFFSDGDVHKYFSPYDTPHEAFVRFTNVLQDLKTRLASGRSLPVGCAATPEPDPEPDREPEAPAVTPPTPESGRKRGSKKKRKEAKQRSTESLE